MTTGSRVSCGRVEVTPWGGSTADQARYEARAADRNRVVLAVPRLDAAAI